MRPTGPRDNCHTVWCSTSTLCIRCKACGHRAGIRNEQLFHRGNMQEIARLNLKCTKCGGREVETFIPMTIGEAAQWVEAERQW